jgi:hypothetical protein
MLPYISVNAGKHKGKIFRTNTNAFKEALIAAFLDEPDAEPAHGDTSTYHQNL